MTRYSPVLGWTANWMLHPASTPSARMIRSADDRGIADSLHEPASRLEIGGRAAPGNRLADRTHKGCESLAVLARGDRLELRPEQLHAVPLENARVGELAAQVQGGLAAHSAQDPLRSLFRDHLLEEFDGERLHVDGVRRFWVGLDRRRVAVHQDDPHAFLSEGSTGLRPGVIEFGGLPDDNGPGTDDHRGPNVAALGHRPHPLRPYPRPP